MDKLRIGILSGAMATLLSVTPSFGATYDLLQGSGVNLLSITDADTVIDFGSGAAEIRKDGSFNIETGDVVKLVAGLNKGVKIEHNLLKFNSKESDLSKYGDPKIDFARAGAFITAEGDSINVETEDNIKLVGDMVRIDHNLLKFVNDAKYPIPTIDFVKEGAKITAEDGLQIEGDKGLNIAGPLTMTGNQTVTGNLTVTGNSTLGNATTDTTTITGATTITTAATGLLNVLTGNLQVGNGTPDVTLGGEDAYVEGTFEVDGAARFDGAVAANGGAVIAGALSSINASSNFATNINTGTSTGAVTIGGGTATQTVAINSADWDITTTGAMTGIGAITADGLITGTLGATISGATTSVNADSNFATNINTGTSNGAVAIGGNSGTVAINSSDWDINATGDMTNIGAITADGTINFTGAITLGDGADAVTIDSVNWDVTAGALTGVTGITMVSGNFGQAGAGTFGTGTGAVSLNGDVGITADKVFLQNGTGTFGTGTGAVSLNGDVAVAANKNLAMTSGTGIATQAFTGTTTTAHAITANSLTTGKALSVTATNTNVADTAVNPVTFNVTNAQSTAANSNVVGVGVNFTNNPTFAGNTEYGMQIQNQVTANATDNAVAALLRLDNADTNATGSTVATAGLLIANSGAIAGGVVDDIVLQNGESIDNATNNQVDINLGTTGTLLLTGGSNITTDQTTFNLLNTVATTLSIGGAATTALNLGNGNTAYVAINLGSGTGGNAINIAGTGATGADVIRIGTGGGGGADTISIGTGGTAGDIVAIGSATAQTVSIADNNWAVASDGAAHFVSVGATSPGTGAFTTLSASSALVIPTGTAPGATCTAGEIYLDTDETLDTNCTTTADNSLCLCITANTWVQLNNN